MFLVVPSDPLGPYLNTVLTILFYRKLLSGLDMCGRTELEKKCIKVPKSEVPH